MNNDIVVGGCRCPNPCLAHPELAVVNAKSLNELAPDLSLPPFWQEIWREAEARIPDDTIKQSCFNDGAHFVIEALKEAAKDIIRLRKIDEAHDGPWEDQDAFYVFNRQISEAYHATSGRWSEIVGIETVDAMWTIPPDLDRAAASDEMLYAALDSWDGEKATFYNPDHHIVKRMRAALEAALATPSPTIAAPLEYFPERAQGVDCYKCEDGEPHTHRLTDDPVERDALASVKAEHDEYHVVYYEDCVWCRSDNVDNLRKRIADLEAPTIAAPFSSARSDWSTPQAFYDALDDEFHFTLDVCATDDNAKHQRYFTEDDDGLSQPWVIGDQMKVPACCWMNPPYGREIGAWMKKAYDESLKGATVVCLVPSRTDTKWWHDYCMKAKEIRYIRGRLKFDGHVNSAPFPSAVVVFRPEAALKARKPADDGAGQ